jgi:hypothetical protein
MQIAEMYQWAYDVYGHHQILKGVAKRVLTKKNL